MTTTPDFATEYAAYVRAATEAAILFRAKARGYRLAADRLQLQLPAFCVSLRTEADDLDDKATRFDALIDTAVEALGEAQANMILATIVELRSRAHRAAAEQDAILAYQEHRG